MARDALEGRWREVLEAARGRLSGLLPRTPLLEARSLSERVGHPVFLKLETRQTTGSFKARGALFSLLSVGEESRRRGIVTSSSGNFAAAAAWAGRLLGCRVRIVMSSGAARYKIERTRRFGGEIVFCGADYAARQATVDRLLAEDGGVEIHPHSSVETIAGNATCGFEILAELPEAGSVLVPTSGGGLLAGIALAATVSGSGARATACQPDGNPTFVDSLRAGRALTSPVVDTIADGLTASSPGALGFSIARELGLEGRRVSEAGLKRAMRGLFEDEGLVVEPSAAVSVAALLEGEGPPLRPPVVCVLTGGNVDPGRYGALIAEGEGPA